MATLKDDWKAVGKEVGATLLNVGDVLLKTVQVGAEKFNAWVDEERKKEQTKQAKK